MTTKAPRWNSADDARLIRGCRKPSTKAVDT
jgi:hypothetical protein